MYKDMALESLHKGAAFLQQLFDDCPWLA